MKNFLSMSAAALSLLPGGVVRATTLLDNQFAPKRMWVTPHASNLGSIMSVARPTSNSQLRRNLDEDAEVDLTSYSIKFEKCQDIKQYAEDHNDETVLETKKFVIFRLCPNASDGSNGCSSSTCKSSYGEYIVDLESYMGAMLQQKSDEQEAYCEACNDCAAAADAEDAADDGRRRRRLTTDVDCDTCYSQCQNIANLEDYGYADAAEYYKCEKVYENENKNLVYYAGAMCSNSGSRIKVGLFTDESCENYDESASTDTYIKKNGYNVKLSYHLMKKTFVADECIASCADVEDDDGGDDDNTEVETTEVCGNLYKASGKCETPHGFASGISSSVTYSDDYSTQVDNEDTVCQYIANINSGAYNDSGELVVKSSTLYIVGGRSTISSVQTTGGQKFALTFFVIGTVGLVAYAAYLRQKVNQCVKQGLIMRNERGSMA